MTASQYFFSLITQSLKRPRDGARQVLLIGLSRQSIWLSLAVTVLLGTLLGYVHQEVAPPAFDMEGNQIRLPSPLIMAAMTAVMLLALDFVTTYLGRGFGGTGNFFDILLMDVWLRALALLFMGLDILAFLISPVLGQLVLYATYLFLFWLMLNFIAEAHGGLSLGKTLVLVLVSGVIALLPIMLVVSMLGVGANMGV